jgi:hypothetical protein
MKRYLELEGESLFVINNRDYIPININPCTPDNFGNKIRGRSFSSIFLVNYEMYTTKIKNKIDEILPYVKVEDLYIYMKIPLINENIYSDIMSIAKHDDYLDRHQLIKYYDDMEYDYNDIPYKHMEMLYKDFKDGNEILNIELSL